MENLRDETNVTQRWAYGFGPYLLDDQARRLTKGGEPVPLTPKSYDVLVLLVTNAGRAVAREEIVERIWPDTFVEAGNLDWHVSTLRKALSESRGAIETVRGFGYRFAVDVTRSAAAAPSAPSEEPAPPDARPAPVPVPPALPRRPDAARSRTAQRVLIAAGVLAAAALAWLAGRSRAPAHTTRPPTVAVLAFENLSGDPQSAWLSLALRELLAAELSQSSNVTMIPGQTVARAVAELKIRGGTLGSETLAALRQSLGTDVVVSGSYVVVGSERKLRIVSALQDCMSARTLATVEQNGTVDEMLAAVSAAGARLRTPFETREPSLKAQQGGTPFTASAEVLRLYVEGLGRMRELRTLEAKELLARAVELDPTFALARSALADAWAELGYEGRAANEAKLAVERSANLPREDRLLVEGRAAELAQKWERATEVYQALVTFFPDSVDYGLKLANAQTHGKRAADARRTLEALAKLTGPKGEDPRIDVARGWTARFLGDFDAMDAAGAEAVKKGRAHGRPQLIAQGLRLRAWSAVTTWRSAESEALSREGAALAKDVGDLGLAANLLSIRGYAFLQLGRFGEARDAFEDGLGISRRIGHVNLIHGLLSGLSQLDLETGDVPRAETEARESLDVARTTGDEAEVIGLLDLSRVLRVKGELAPARQLAAEALEKSRHVAIDSRVSLAQQELGEALFLSGDLPAARAAFTEALALRAKAGGTRQAAVRTRLARIALLEGRADEAVSLARAAVAEVSPHGGVAADAHGTLGEALAASGAEEARAELASGAALLDAAGGGTLTRLDLDLQRARALVRLGDAAAARTVLAAAERVARDHGFPAQRLEASLGLARLDAAARVAGAPARCAAIEADAKSRGDGLAPLVWSAVTSAPTLPRRGS